MEEASLAELDRLLSPKATPLTKLDQLLSPKAAAALRGPAMWRSLGPVPGSPLLGTLRGAGQPSLSVSASSWADSPLSLCRPASMPQLHAGGQASQGGRRLRSSLSKSFTVKFGNGAFGPPLLAFEPGAAASALSPLAAMRSPSAGSSGGGGPSPSPSRGQSRSGLGSPSPNRKKARGAVLAKLEAPPMVPPVDPALAALAAAAAAPPSPGREYRKECLKRYTEYGSVRAALRGGDTVLLKGSWLRDLSEEEGATLPRRQDLPPEAVWDVDELMRGINRRGYKIIAVSHCWFSPEHPDPEGAKLRHLGEFIKAWAHVQHGMLAEHMAIFFDWCSIPQEPRSEHETSMFERALEHVQIWYSHQATHLWVLPDSEEGSTPFYERGWPTTELALAALTKPTDHIIDLSRRKNGARHQEFGWPTTLEAVNVLIEADSNVFDEVALRSCIMPRQAPMAPKSFGTALQQKKFGNVADHDVVLKMYTEVFLEIAGYEELLDFSGLGWDDFQVDVLATSLPSFPRLRELNLANNEIEDNGAAALAEVIPLCGALQRLFLYGNEVEMGLEGYERLLAAWRAAGKDERWLWISVPTHSEYIMKKLSQ